MSDDLTMKVEIVGRDQASASIKAVEQALVAMARQAEETGKVLKASLGGNLSKRFEALKVEAEAFGKAIGEAGEITAKALRSDVAAAVELREALHAVVAEQKAMGGAAKAARTASASAGASEVRSIRTAASARATAAGTDLRGIRQRWAVRDRSAKAEARQASEASTAWAESQRRRMSLMDRSAAVEARRQRDEVKATRDSSRAASEAADRRIAGVRRAWGVRERSEAAELRHVATMRRERTALRGRASAAGRHAMGHAHHAIRSVNHPVHESLGFALTAGATAGAAFAEHVVGASERFDTSMSRLRMFAPGLDASAIRKTALSDSINLGVDASKIVDMIAKSVRDGVPSAIAELLPKSIVQTAQVMGGDIERLTDSLAEGIQESTAMGWIKNQADARRFLNIEAGLSTTAGNTSEKTEQFIAAGGLGHGKEMGLDLEKTMAYGAMLNASGSRTGQASARFMGQLSQNVPKMFDKWMGSVESHKSTEESRAVMSAPQNLGYGGIREMQSQIMAGPEGLIDFATRLQSLDDKARKLVLEGYGFSEQGGAMLAELGSGGGAKGKSVLVRAKELAEQKESNDYLSEKFNEWSKSLSFMLQQIEAGWRAIENEIGDTIKDDIIAPLRDWWVLVSSAIVNSNLKGQVHAAIAGFVKGLGFDDVRAMLDSLSSNVGGFDVVGFMKGVGEGIRAVVDQIRSIAGLFGGVGGLSAETVGRIATEFLGLSVALRLVAPLASTIGGIASAMLALKAAVEGVAWVSKLAGITGALEAGGGAAAAGEAVGLGALAIGMLPVTIAAVAVGAIAVTVMNWDELRSAWADTVDHFRGLITGKPVERSAQDKAIQEGERQRAETLPDAQRKMPDQLGPDGFVPISYQGESADNWRSMMTPASYEPSDSAEVARDAMLDTPRRVIEVREAIDRLAERLKIATVAGSDDVEASSGTGEGGGTANLRYGRGARGGYRGTPGTGQDYETGPKVSLGKMGAKFAAKAPVIMDGLMKKYGLTREQAAGVVGNLGHESGGFTKYHEGGQAPGKGGVGWAQWTGPRRRAFETWTQAHGLNPTSDEASWRYLTEGDPETAKAIQAVKGQSTRHGAMKAWEGSFERAGVKNYASRDRFADAAFAGTPGGATVEAPAPGGGGNSGGAVDKAMAMLGMGEAQSAHELGKRMSPGEWCADFVNGALNSAGVKGTNSSMAASFSQWGRHVGGFAAQKGDVIEERHGNHVGHVGLATGNVQRDRSGNVTAVEMVSGNYGNMVRKNWEKVGIIADLRRSDQAVAAAARQVAQPPTGDTAHEVIRRRKPAATEGDAPMRGHATTSADAGDDAKPGQGGHHFEMHFHSQVADASEHANHVGRAIDDVLRNRSHDIDYQAA